MAERLGLPLPLIRRAESLLKSGQSSVEKLMQTLADERERTETMRTEAERRVGLPQVKPRKHGAPTTMHRVELQKRDAEPMTKRSRRCNPRDASYRI